MLSYALAIAVATSSLVLFLTAFVMSDIHRRDDFLWSGVGLFYAAVLWFCARNITGAVLLGQAAATVLLVSYIWQTLKLRKAIANPERAAEISNFSILKKVNSLLKRDRPEIQPTTPPQTPITEKVTESKIAIPDTATEGKAEQTSEKVVATEPAKAEEAKQDESLDQKVVPSEPVATPQATKPVITGNKDRDEAPTEQQTPESTPKPAPLEELSRTESEPTTEERTSKLQDTGKVAESSPKSKDAEDLSSTVKSEQPAREEPATEQTSQLQDTGKVAESSPKSKDAEDLSSTVKSEQPAREEPATEQTSQLQDSDRVTESSPKSEDTEDLPLATDKEEPTTEQVTEIVAPETEKASKKSHLDSLETVEVAEVLEADTEENRDRQLDRSNVIEVTTTEIDITTTEVAEVEPDSEENSEENTESQDKQ